MARNRVAALVVALAFAAGCVSVTPFGQPHSPGPAADGVVRVAELPRDAREEVTRALERGQYRASDLAFLDAVNASRAFVVAHDGERYWPSVETVSDEQGRAYALTMRRVYRFDALPADVRREIRAAIAGGAYENDSLAFLAWTEDGPHPVVERDGAYYRTCVRANGDYALRVEPLDSVRERDADYC